MVAARALKRPLLSNDADLFFRQRHRVPPQRNLLISFINAGIESNTLIFLVCTLHDEPSPCRRYALSSNSWCHQIRCFFSLLSFEKGKHELESMVFLHRPFPLTSDFRFIFGDCRSFQIRS